MHLSGKRVATSDREIQTALPSRWVGGAVYGIIVPVSAAGAVLAFSQYAFNLIPALQLPGPVWAVIALLFFIVFLQGGLIGLMMHQRRKRPGLSLQLAARYRALCDISPDMITRHDADGRIRYASPATAALLGYAPEALVGRAPTDLVHAEDLAAFQTMRNALVAGQTAELEMRLRRADASYVWVAAHVCPVPGRRRNHAGTVAVCRDITAVKERESQLIAACGQAEAANQAKTLFFAHMSHELRTPLNAILGFSDVMVQEMFGPLGASRYMEYSRLIHESGSHLLELINSVLDLSKIEAGKLEILEEEFDLAPVVESALRFIRLAAERAGVRLVTDIDPAAAEIRADRRALGQMLINLFSNAVKFTPTGGEVCLTARRRDTGIEIAVSDTGSGIAPADLKRLGRPFEQTRDAAGKEGTGLGLALVKAYAAMHGGDVILQSALGVGTTVRLVFPHGVVKSSVYPPHAVPALRTVA